MRLIQAGDFTAYPDALRFVIATKDAGMLIADASSSKNAAYVEIICVDGRTLNPAYQGKREPDHRTSE